MKSSDSDFNAYHGIDSRYTGPHKVAPTMSARYGTGFSEPRAHDTDSHD